MLRSAKQMVINVKRFLVKRLLADALIELSDEKSLTKITVQDITAKVGAGRQTFYNHFKDKDDLVYWIFLRTLRGEKRLIETSGYFAYLCNIYSEAQKNRLFLAKACKLTGQNSLADGVYQQTYNYYKNYVLSRRGCDVCDENLEYALKFNAYGASSLYLEWAKNGMPGSPDEQAINALRCMPKCIKDYLPLTDEERAY
jgi:hypothetical protein